MAINTSKRADKAIDSINNILSAYKNKLWDTRVFENLYDNVQILIQEAEDEEGSNSLLGQLLVSITNYEDYVATKEKLDLTEKEFWWKGREDKEYITKIINCFLNLHNAKNLNKKVKFFNAYKKAADNIKNQIDYINSRVRVEFSNIVKEFKEELEGLVVKWRMRVIIDRSFAVDICKILSHFEKIIYDENTKPCVYMQSIEGEINKYVDKMESIQSNKDEINLCNATKPYKTTIFEELKLIISSIISIFCVLQNEDTVINIRLDIYSNVIKNLEALYNFMENRRAKIAKLFAKGNTLGIVDKEKLTLHNIFIGTLPITTDAIKNLNVFKGIGIQKIDNLAWFRTADGKKGIENSIQIFQKMRNMDCGNLFQSYLDKIIENLRCLQETYKRLDQEFDNAAQCVENIRSCADDYLERKKRIGAFEKIEFMKSIIKKAEKTIIRLQ